MHLRICGYVCLSLGLLVTDGFGQARRERKADDDGVVAHRDLVYARVDQRALLLDIYLPANVENPPLIVWVHGGAWRKGSKGDGGRIRWMTEYGYAVASINYRLSQEAIFPAQIHDCKAAIRWLRAHAGSYGYDANRIGAAGSSAGGHLVALLGTTGDLAELEGDLGDHLQVSSRVQAVCDMWGPTDFLQMGGWHNGPQSPESQLIGGPIGENKAKVARANPITYVNANAPAFLILHGDQDKTVTLNQSELLDSALKKVGVPVDFQTLKGAGHGVRGYPVQKFNSMVRAFFDQHLKSAGAASPRPHTSKSKAKKADAPPAATSAGLKIFSGQPRLLIVHGYSTSQHWWAFLQRKIDRYRGGAQQRVIEVQLCNKGGTPIARWMNIETGEPAPAWRRMFTPMVQAEKGRRPVMVLAQQSLQFVYPERAAGIRNAKDHERIERGADVIAQYCQRILEDGAAAVMVGMHIYKLGMEPQIGNERLALAELMKRKLPGVFAGPDTWTPTSKQHPLAFDTDKRHPNYIGAEIMAHFWFEALLQREGLDVPAWSLQEMHDAIQNKPMGLTRDRAAFQQKLAEWKIVRRRDATPSGSPESRPRPAAAAGRRLPSRRILDRYDTDGDGKLNPEERAAFERARKKRQKKAP